MKIVNPSQMIKGCRYKGKSGSTWRYLGGSIVELLVGKHGYIGREGLCKMASEYSEWKVMEDPFVEFVQETLNEQNNSTAAD